MVNGNEEGAGRAERRRPSRSTGPGAGPGTDVPEHAQRVIAAAYRVTGSPTTPGRPPDRVSAARAPRNGTLLGANRARTCTGRPSTPASTCCARASPRGPRRSRKGSRRRLAEAPERGPDQQQGSRESATRSARPSPSRAPRPPRSSPCATSRATTTGDRPHARKFGQHRRRDPAPHAKESACETKSDPVRRRQVMKRRDADLDQITGPGAQRDPREETPDPQFVAEATDRVWEQLAGRSRIGGRRPIPEAATYRELRRLPGIDSGLPERRARAQRACSF